MIQQPDEQTRLRERVGRLHMLQRQGIQRDHAAQVFGRGRNFFHIENWYSIHAWMRLALRLTGLYRRGQRNAADIQLQHNPVTLPTLPEIFNGYTLLHLSDLHLDMSGDIAHALIEQVRPLDYDICVITGDLRARTFGSIDASLDEMEKLLVHLRRPVYAVLGNHDFIEMVPRLEDMGVRMLVNETVVIEKGSAHLFLSGIDDGHYYRVDNMEKAAVVIPEDACSVLLSHTPEVFRHAAYAGFDLMLCGHTHGGQICLPGGFALTYNASCPRELCDGAWSFQGMQGYTSRGSGACVVDVRFNCPPEITLHRLEAVSTAAPAGEAGTAREI